MLLFTALGNQNGFIKEQYTYRYYLIELTNAFGVSLVSIL